jgi:hypothetical protein
MPGWLAWVVDEDLLVAWDGSGWTTAGGGGGGSGGGSESAPLFGVNATADATNRLSVKSDAVLLSHDDVTPGSGDMRAVANKADVSNTASFLFQTDSSGRAEFGLAGDDDWHVKVSADGASWKEALVADRNTGRVAFPQGLEHAATHAALSGLIFTPGGDGQISIWRFDAPRSANPRTATIGSVSGNIITLSTATAGLFFNHALMAGVSMVRVWNTSKTPNQSAWVKAQPSGTTLEVLSAASISAWANGETLQLGEPGNATRPVAVDISPMLQTILGTVFRQSGLILRVVAEGDGILAQIAASGTGTSGSYVAAESFTNGTLQNNMLIVPTVDLSPVSNSNLVYMRESDGGANTLKIALASVMAVLA